MASPATNLRPGHTLNHYRVESILGEGTFGVTYLAQDTRSALKVAIKEYLPMDYAARALDQRVHARTKADAEMFDWGLRRFADEARALASLQHPGIVRLLNYFEANGTAYMVMELVEGEPLSAWTEARRPLPQSAMLAISVALLDGLNVIHAAHFLHRDIKPSNILIRYDGRPVLLDFGSAREVSPEQQRLTSLVSPGYAPLEQYTETGKQGPWSDLYALGGVMYWMVTGRRPVEAAARVRKDIMTPASAYQGTHPSSPYTAAFLKAIDWALTPDEAARPQSAAELLRALREPEEPEATVRVAPPANPAAAPVDTAFSRELLKSVEVAAAKELGPIAPIVVRNAMRKSSTIPQLCSIVADNMTNEKARAEFLKQFAPPS